VVVQTVKNKASMTLSNMSSSITLQPAGLGLDVAKIQIKSDISSYFMFFQQKSLKKLGMFGNNAYLCSVKRGIRRKDDNLYGLQRSFRAPKITSHH
jgi:hypothetical protein